MSWSDKLMASLDERAIVLKTSRGAVQLAREGEGPPVLVSHGGPGGFDQALAWCRHLRDGGCELLAPSRPGYLRTPLESGRSPEDQADLYAAILDALHIDRAVALGFSSGGPSAAHFAARHPDRISVLLLDTAILQPFEPPISTLERAALESSSIIWLSYQMACRRPKLMTRWAVGGMSEGLTKERKKAASDWITSDPDRLHDFQEALISVAPRKYREPGWANDQVNEAALALIPFADITAPTLIAQGTNDGIVPVGHATNAADRIAGAELIFVQEGHHALSLSRDYERAAQRQLELVHG